MAKRFAPARRRRKRSMNSEWQSHQSTSTERDVGTYHRQRAGLNLSDAHAQRATGCRAHQQPRLLNNREARFGLTKIGQRNHTPTGNRATFDLGAQHGQTSGAAAPVSPTSRLERHGGPVRRAGARARFPAARTSPTHREPGARTPPVERGQYAELLRGPQPAGRRLRRRVQRKNSYTVQPNVVLARTTNVLPGRCSTRPNARAMAVVTEARTSTRCSPPGQQHAGNARWDRRPARCLQRRLEAPRAARTTFDIQDRAHTRRDRIAGIRVTCTCPSPG